MVAEEVAGLLLFLESEARRPELFGVVTRLEEEDEAFEEEEEVNKCKVSSECSAGVIEVSRSPPELEEAVGVSG